MRQGPAIERLTRRLAECPAEFLAEPRLRGKPEGIHLDAVVADLLDDLGAHGLLTDADAAAWELARAQDRNLMRLTLVACWLCHEPLFLDARTFGPFVRKWLSSGLRPLAEIVAADLFVSDPDRREELARALLDALDLAPEGETAEVAADRLKALNSVERARVIRKMQQQQALARKLQKKMEEDKARQAAARYGSE